MGLRPRDAMFHLFSVPMRVNSAPLSLRLWGKGALLTAPSSPPLQLQKYSSLLEKDHLNALKHISLGVPVPNVFESGILHFKQYFLPVEYFE